MAETKPSSYKNFEDYYDVESPIGRKKFLEKQKQEKQVQLEKQEVLKAKGLLPKQQLPSRVGKQIGSFFKPEKRISTPRFSPPAPMLSREQNLMQEMFGGRNRTWGTGQNLPQLNRSLISGGGLIKTGDQGATGRLFGVRR